MPKRGKWLIILFVIVNITSIEITTEDLKSAWNWVCDKIVSVIDGTETDPSIEENTQMLLNKAQSFYDARDYKKAVETYSEVIRLNDADTLKKAYFYRGKSYLELDEYAMAVADFSKVIELDPNDSGMYKARALIYAKSLHSDWLAIADYSKAIELNPNDADAYFMRGILYARELNRYDLAIFDMSKNIQLDPNDPNPYYWRGVFYKELGDAEKAKADLARAEQLGYYD